MPGVAEVAPLGGFVRQYQVNVDPNRLQTYNIPIMKVVEAVRNGNNDVGGRLVEFSGAEYMVRGRGYAKSVDDIGNIVLASSPGGVPIRVWDVGDVVLGPDIRRGIADLNGEGDVVSGIVVMRQGQNALDVIERVKAKLKEIEPGLPPGVKIVSTYDRSDLILRSIENLKGTLIEEIAIVSIIILIFLWHIPSAIIPVITIPIAIIISFIPMKMMGLTSNIMSLGGIAIAIGAMVDAAIVVVEQTHKKLEEWERTGRKEDYHRVVIDAVKEVGGPSFFALLVIAVSFLPVLTLEAQEGRLFKPLAYTKNFSMIVAAVLAITLDPAMRLLFTHMKNFEFRPRWLARATNAVLVGKIHSEENHPISKILIRLYEPVCAWSLRWKYLVIAGAIAHGRPHRADLPEARLGIHAAARRRHAAVHALHPARHFRDRRAEVDAGPGPHHQTVPRSRVRHGKGRPRGDVDGPRAVLHDGDGHRVEAPDRVAQTRHVVLVMGARSGRRGSSGMSHPTTSPPNSWSKR